MVDGLAGVLSAWKDPRLTLFLYDRFRSFEGTTLPHVMSEVSATSLTKFSDPEAVNERSESQKVIEWARKTSF